MHIVLKQVSVFFESASRVYNSSEKNYHLK